MHSKVRNRIATLGSKWLFTLVLAGLISQPTLAQTAVSAPVCPPELPAFTPEVVAKGQRSAKDGGFLFSFEKDGKISWLYGTMHVGTMETVFPGPKLVTAMRQAKALALELDFSNVPQLLADLEAANQSAVNQQLATPARLSRIAEAARDNCTPAARLQAQPIVLQAMTLLMNEAKYQGLYAELGQEPVLLAMAQALKHGIFGLETVQTQLQALLGDDAMQSAALVDEILTDLKSPKTVQSMADLVHVWQKQDWARLSDYLGWCRCMDTPAEKQMMRRILDQRNPAMVARTLALHEAQGGGLFVGVGALHLIGETGMVRALERAGFKVSKLF